ncbi:MAG: ORF6N domain-containing protein [Bacteroidota bacterium]
MSHHFRDKRLDHVESLIVVIRGKKVIFDNDLAGIYGVTTRRLNEQVKRNFSRFPADFMFRLKRKEFESLMSQIATSNGKRGGRRKLPFVFTEFGALMAANVLNSNRAVRMSVFVVRAFVKMRGALSGTAELTRKLSELEKELKTRLNVHENAIVGILQRIMAIIDPPHLPEPRRKAIGFK